MISRRIQRGSRLNVSMRIQTFYRLMIWLPIAVPSALLGVTRGIGLPLDVPLLNVFVQVLLGSLLYGGIPYAILALWATFWISNRNESIIERLMLRAPLIMGITFIPFALAFGIAVHGEPAQFFGLSLFGAVMSIVVGYGYVAAVIVMRRSLGERLLTN